MGGGIKTSSLLGFHFQLLCKHCHEVFDDFKELKSHLKEVHQIRASAENRAQMVDKTPQPSQSQSVSGSDPKLKVSEVKGCRTRSQKGHPGHPPREGSSSNSNGISSRSSSLNKRERRRKSVPDFAYHDSRNGRPETPTTTTPAAAQITVSIPLKKIPQQEHITGSGSENGDDGNSAAAKRIKLSVDSSETQQSANDDDGSQILNVNLTQAVSAALGKTYVEIGGNSTSSQLTSGSGSSSSTLSSKASASSSTSVSVSPSQVFTFPPSVSVTAMATVSVSKSPKPEVARLPEKVVMTTTTVTPAAPASVDDDDDVEDEEFEEEEEEEEEEYQAEEGELVPPAFPRPPPQVKNGMRVCSEPGCQQWIRFRKTPLPKKRKGKQSTRNFNLEWKEHLEIHQGLRTFVCPYCLRGFKEAVQLLTHTSKEHTGSSPFQCDTCSKAFQSHQALHCHQIHAKTCKIRDAIWI